MSDIIENKKLIERMIILMDGQKPPPFARKCNIDPKTVYSILKGEIDPGPKTLNKIALANKVQVGWILGISEIGGPEKYQLQVSEDIHKNGYRDEKRGKYERLLHKFEYIFDFLIEWHGDDSREIDLFLERMKKDFLIHDPNYRQWTYDRDEKAKERLKNMLGEDHQDRAPDIKSANDS